MPYDYAPRLAARAKARHRRHVWFTACLLILPALSFHMAPGAAAELAKSSAATR